MYFLSSRRSDLLKDYWPDWVHLMFLQLLASRSFWWAAGVVYFQLVWWIILTCSWKTKAVYTWIIRWKCFFFMTTRTDGKCWFNSPLVGASDKQLWCCIFNFCREFCICHLTEDIFSCILSLNFFPDLCLDWVHPELIQLFAAGSVC